VSDYIERYLADGYSDIVVLSHDYEESASSHLDTTRETVIARKRGDFFKLETHERRNYLKMASNEFTQILTSISVDEYKTLCARKAIIDTPQVREKIARKKKHARAADVLKARLKAVTPQCPKCHGEMTRRTGPKGPFWGCKQFPNCKGTVSLSIKARTILQKIRDAE
jgi:topoisomerase-like DNA binding C4 zinc finger protein